MKALHNIVSYLKAAQFDPELAIDGRIGLVDGVGEREEQQRKPDDEDQDEQEQPAHAVFDHGTPLRAAWERVLVLGPAPALQNANR